MRVAGVLFDKDGVLVDFHRTWGPACASVIRSLAEGDAALESALADAIDFELQGARFRPESVFIAGSGLDTLKAWSGVLGTRNSGALALRILELMTEAGLEGVAPAPGLDETLLALGARGLPLGIATNDQEASARAQMAKLGLTERFGFIAGADSGHGPKPGPGMVLAFADAIGAEPERVVMVGDSLHDIDAARAAGAIAVAIGTGPAPLETLAPHADHAVADLTALARLLEIGLR